MSEIKATKGKLNFRKDKNPYTIKHERKLHKIGQELSEIVLFEKEIAASDYMDAYGRIKRNERGTPLRNIDVYKSLVECNDIKYDIYMKFCIDRKKYLPSCGYDNGKTFSLSFFDNAIQGLNSAYDFIAKNSLGN